jgi:hypothetical protein
MHCRRVGTRGISLVLVAAAGCTGWHTAPMALLVRNWFRELNAEVRP